MLSYARGPDAQLSDLTIDACFRQTVARVPDCDALVVCHQNVRLTYAQLDAEVERVARGLRGLGLRNRDRFGVWATNCFEWYALQLASARAGLVLVNVNPAYRAFELEYVLDKSRMRALFLHEQDEYSDFRAILAEARAKSGDCLEGVVYLGTADWNRFLAGGAEVGDGAATCHDVANMQYTSGTTGSPKGVLLTHRNLLNNGRFIAQWLRYSEADRICCPVPMYHCFGCVIGSMAAISSGAAMIFPAPKFIASATLRAIERERATSIYGVPTMFIAQLNHPEFCKTDFSSLRTGVMAGAPCPIEVMKRVAGEMHCPEMTIMYGQTEASPVITGSSVYDTLERRVSTVGKTFPMTEVKIVQPETGETLPTGKQGELYARGYMVMKGYDGDPDATARTIDGEGWLHTGDLAVMREDGYINITGRAKDVILRGGENVYPREVEEFLFTHPKVAEAQVVGLPDIRLGEAVLAWIRLKDGCQATEKEIRDYCRGRIAHFKIPKYIRFVDGFPLTVTGKVQKYVIRNREIEARGLQSAARIETA